jgi:hypothetical protein
MPERAPVPCSFPDKPQIVTFAPCSGKKISLVGRQNSLLAKQGIPHANDRLCATFAHRSAPPGRADWLLRCISSQREFDAVPGRRTELTAAEAVKSGRATFFLNMTVRKAVDLTGTFVNTGISANRHELIWHLEHLILPHAQLP